MILTRFLPGPGRPFTGLHMLTITVLFFSTIAAVNVGMAIASIRTWTGLVVQNSYVASQEFDDRLAAHRRQLALGWASSLNVSEDEATLTIVDGQGRPVDLGEVSLAVNRPVGAADDRHLVMQRGADGVYRAPLELPPGMWEMKASAEDTAEGPFLLHRRLSVE